MKLTREQRLSLVRIYNRVPLRHVPTGGGRFEFKESLNPYFKPVSFLEFRRAVQSGYGCAMVQWCGMWIGIEFDGYSHT